MAVKLIQSHQELLENLKGKKFAYLLLYKGGSEPSECARKNVERVAGKNPEAALFLADVSKVKDIHPHYGVHSVPTLIQFEDGKFRNTIKGCQQADFYQNFLDQVAYELKAGSENKPMKRVTVYSTKTCPWCTTLKNYLRKNGIHFTDVDVSRDQRAAEEMVRKSGQQGVPQTDINGEMIIGFDQKKLNQLLEIKTIG